MSRTLGAGRERSEQPLVQSTEGTVAHEHQPVAGPRLRHERRREAIEFLVHLGEGAERLQRLAHVYMGADVIFPPEAVRDQPGFILRITPERLGGVGPWA